MHQSHIITVLRNRFRELRRAKSTDTKVIIKRSDGSDSKVTSKSKKIKVDLTLEVKLKPLLKVSKQYVPVYRYLRGKTVLLLAVIIVH